ncbi:hypothetical protein [Gloeothece verrucosa]|uniref:Helix-turn-helix domain-containing protein n=1 Tax=Gloeothece verrucosa (strain PCC 7822) TaxID=497965 RepID=E0UAF3_GLOV7|nr:hypothetical protein [Gloeothece verrucosa]ADN12694.1 hypothetical protein Cyan7822_0658 [Gloeothece verrucosa PCC 7822]
MIIKYQSVQEYAKQNFMCPRNVTRKCKLGEIKAKKLKGQWLIIVSY